jgi:ring-1,2-phenylacetyl-CoA epoxidase subunit PaaE
MAAHFHKLTVKEVKAETADCVSIAFHVPVNLQNEFVFEQGQNITIKKEMDGEEIRRSYSICCKKSRWWKIFKLYQPYFKSW